MDKFLELVKPHYSDALRYCRALCSGRHSGEAKDVLQQAFLRALENFGMLKEEAKFKSWFFKIITNCFYDVTRKNFWKNLISLELYEAREDIPDVYTNAVHSDTRNLVSAALERLSDKERIAVLLFEIEGFSIEEITELQQERSISAVKSRLSRARKKLKDIITGLESDYEKHLAGNIAADSEIIY
ncbi:MAG: RNA polymerase sigma factor [Ignavibacteriae bacterium]|nr:RNA polymerase sigma factor [Ignavibacteriota bacterium]